MTSPSVMALDAWLVCHKQIPDGKATDQQEKRGRRTMTFSCWDMKPNEFKGLHRTVCS